MKRISIVVAGLILVASLHGCGGGDDGGDPNVSEAELKACLEEAGANLRDIDVSLVDPPPDFSAKFGSEQATIWVEDSREGAAEVADSQEALKELDDSLSELANGSGKSESDDGPPIEIGNVFADPFLGPLSDETRATIEGCVQ